VAGDPPRLRFRTSQRPLWRVLLSLPVLPPSNDHGHGHGNDDDNREAPMVRHCIPEIPNVPIPRCSVFCFHFLEGSDNRPINACAALSLSPWSLYYGHGAILSLSLSLSPFGRGETTRALFIIIARGGKYPCSSLFAIVNNPFPPHPHSSRKGECQIIVIVVAVVVVSVIAAVARCHRALPRPVVATPLHGRGGSRRQPAPAR
jgi:hypothetical protein